MSGRFGSLVDDLCGERGIVRGRAGLLSRSSEIKPSFRGSVIIYNNFYYYYLLFQIFFFPILNEKFVWIHINNGH